jgi:comEA protein
MDIQPEAPMISFTPQESRILLFLVAALLLGSAISLYRHHRLHVTSELSVKSLEVIPGSRASDSSEVENVEEVFNEKLNINTATSQELQLLPGIGPQLARRIVAHRQTHGLFSSPSQITEVRGIGEKTLRRITGLITVDETIQD